MDKNVIEKRLAELRKALEQTQASGNAIIGAIQDCEYWLSVLDKEKAEGIIEREIEHVDKKKGNGS